MCIRYKQTVSTNPAAFDALAPLSERCASSREAFVTLKSQLAIKMVLDMKGAGAAAVRECLLLRRTDAGARFAP